ncbi:MAG: hypothetical protein GF364_10995 [Candidatus Lokiarchaeota archaeon]|nr:hypothetical protein [Candidatus Lokiarchaeota archaeon]
MNWSIDVDYYFDEITGLLIAEELYLYRYEYHNYYPDQKYDEEELHVYRTIAIVNEISTLDYSSAPIWLYIMISSIIGIVSVIIYILFKNRGQTDEPISQTNRK